MRFAVIGDPVEHSRSPAIHRAAFMARDIDASYEAVRVPGGEFASVVADLRSGRFAGVNVTMPHKDAAYGAVDVLDTAASVSRSVNTIVASKGELHGYNTDVAGVLYGVARLDLPHDLPVLILGYGGAARAAAVALQDRVVHVSGRDPERAATLVAIANGQMTLAPWGSPVVGAIVVNATPLGMHGEHLPPGILEDAGGILDMAYGDEPTPAIARAAALGIPYADGIDMLTGQALEAFERFTGMAAPRNVMARAARSC